MPEGHIKFKFQPNKLPQLVARRAIEKKKSTMLNKVSRIKVWKVKTKRNESQGFWAALFFSISK